MYTINAGPSEIVTVSMMSNLISYSADLSKKFATMNLKKLNAKQSRYFTVR